MATATIPCLFGQAGALRLLKEYPGNKATTNQLYEYMTKNYPPIVWMNRHMLRKALTKLRSDGVIAFTDEFSYAIIAKAP